MNTLKSITGAPFTGILRVVVSGLALILLDYLVLTLDPELHGILLAALRGVLGQ